MRASSPRRLTPELPSSPPAPVFVGTEDNETPYESWPSSPNANIESALSETETLGPSSPELPPLSAPPRLGLTPRTPRAGLSNATSEGTFYTASWGSPYEIPSNSALWSRSHRHRSSTASLDDIGEDSPNLQFGLSHLLSSRLPQTFDITPTRPNTPSHLVPDEETPRSSNAVSIGQQFGDNPSRKLITTFAKYSRPETPTWTGRDQLRNSSGTNTFSDWVNSKVLQDQANSAAAKEGSLAKRHRSRKSNLTLRQEDILPSLPIQQRSSAMETSKYATPPKSKTGQPAAGGPNQFGLQPASPSITDRVTPPPLGERTASTLSVPVSSSKKRVTYKGKSCWISIPVDPKRGGEGNPPVPLSLAEVTERLAQFENAGYDTRGFGHWRTTNKEEFPEYHAQNSAIFPDPVEQYEESKRRNFRVRFADKGAWDAYVKFLTEEKLRLLGVSLDAPEEVSMSRQASSSQFSPHPFPPPMPTSSAGSQRIGPAGNVFPTGFIPGSSNHTSTRSIASPISSIGNPRASLHMHRQSMYASPSMAPQHAMSPPGFTSWSPQPFGSHHTPLPTASPAISSGRPDLRSPISPFSAAPDGAGPFPFAQRDELLAQMQRQQQQHLLKQQQQMLPVRPASTLQEVPEAEIEEEQVLQARPVPEIVNPKPGHRHNISAKLEENVNNTDYRLDKLTPKQSEHPKEMTQKAFGEGQFSQSAETPRTIPEWRKNAPPLARERSDGPVHTESKNTNDADELKHGEGEGVGRSYGLEQAISEADAHTTDNEHDGKLGSGLASSTISNPWENDSTFQPKTDLTKPPTTRRHSSKFSFSKLNVEAKEFNPRANPSATFNPGIFSSSSFAFQPAKAKPFVPRSSREFSPGAPSIVNGSNSTFNVNAPAFSPSSISGMSSSEFSFATKGPAFKPTAPVFQPKSLGFISDRSVVTSDSDNSNRIFSDLNFADIVKPTKKSAAVPILPPTLQELKQNNGLREDEDGRITQDNVKRARRFGDDGDDVPQFALPDPLPPSQASLPSNDVEDDVEDLQGNAANEMSTTLVMEETDSVTGADATAEKLIDRVLTPASTEDITVSPIVLGRASGMPIPVGQGGDSPGVSSLEDEAEYTPTISQPEMTQTSRITSASSALSALARPFEFKSTFETTGQSTPEKQTRDFAEPLLSPPSSSTAFRSDAEHAERRLTDNIKKRSPSRLPSSVRYYDDQEQPSFQEIDAVMQQFNEGGSDFGVERDDRSWPDSSVKDESTRQLEGAPELAAKLRSDAPSPSPRRALLRPILPVDLDSASVTQDPFSDGRAAVGSESPIRRLNDPDAVPVSDWDEFVSSGDDERIQSQGKFLDSHVSELINGALLQRLNPVEKQLQMIQESLTAISTGGRSNGRVRSHATIDSDADDEDDDVETDLNSRSWSPKRDRRMDKFKAAVQDALSNHHRNLSPSPRSVDLVGILEALAEVKLTLSESASKTIQVDDVKTAVDAAIAQQNLAFAQSRAITNEDDEPTSQISAKYMEAVARVAEETEARKTMERREAETQRMLKLAEEELSLLRESSRDDTQRLHALEEDSRSSRARLAGAEADRAELQKNMVSMSESNAALKATLEEYRVSHTKWREDIERVSHDKEKLAGAFGALKIQTEEAVRIRETMRERLEKLQTDATSATGKLIDERAKWQRTDAEHRTRYEILRNQVQAEARTRERLETELERLEVQEREAMKLRAILEHAQQEKNRLQADVESFLVKEREAARAAITLEHLQKENAKLEELVDTLRNESSEHEKAAEKYAREYREAREAGRMEVQRTRMLLQADIETANSHVNVIRADMESELTRVRGELESARMDLDSARAKQELILEQEADSKRDAIRDVIEGKTAALHDQKLAFEERLEDLRKQHRRDLDHVIENKNQAETFLRESHTQRLAELEQQNQRVVEQALEDKDRAEVFFTDRLTLDSSRIEHLEDKIIHLEEKLEISKSAAQAAVQAAQSAKAPRASSISIAPRAPERTGISAQALRESIGVLQDQLQEREIRIESLEQQLSEVDKDLPEKLRARDTEIGWLRELLGVRVDDLSELVEILGQDNFSRDAVRNAAIRIRAGLQMEMHEKERQANGGGPLSAVPTNLASSIQNFASPRAAQLARAIGEWRNTPNRSRSPTSQSFLAGLMTPPASNLRRTPPAPSTAELSLGNAASSSKAFGKPLTVRQQEKSKAPLLETPSTPPLLRKASYDQDAESGRYSSSGFYDDEDSTVDGTPRAERRRSFGPHSPRSQRM